MRNSTKLILVLAAGMAVTAGAGATATYAWFRTTRTAEMSIANASIWGNGDLNVAYEPVDFGGVSSSAVNNKNGFDMTSASNNVTDISGNGIAMYQPNWNPNVAENVEEALSINSVANSASKTYFIRFGVVLTNKGSEPFNVYVNGGSAVSPVSSADADVASSKSIRMAFWDQSSSTIYSTWQPDDTDGTDASSYHYVIPSTGKTLYGVSDFDVANPAATTFHAGDFNVITSAAQAVDGQKIVAVPGNSSVTVQVSVWIEGTLASATKTCVNGKVSIILDLIAI